MTTLTSFDLLALTAPQQDVLRCLTRTPNLTVSEIMERVTQHSAKKVVDTINEMVSLSYLVECLQENRRVFQLKLGQRHANVRNMPKAIVDFFEQPLDQFLATVPIGRTLDEEVRADLLQFGRTYRLTIDEVFVWQGDLFQQVALVRNGLLCKQKLQGNQQTVSYVQTGEWIGIEDVLNQMPSTETYKAMTNTALIVWPTHQFLECMRHQPQLSLSIANDLSTKLQECQTTRQRGRQKVWLIDGVESGVGVSTLALNLALLAQGQNRVVFWDWYTPNRAEHQWVKQVGTELLDRYLWRCSCGFDHFHPPKTSDLPTTTYIDIILAHLRKRYDIIICDVGYDTHPLLDQLYKWSDVRLTITDDVKGIGLINTRWRGATAPKQKRFAVYNHNRANGAESDFTMFQVVLPHDEGDGRFTQTCQELYRRLSLDHTVAIFVPSTTSVDQVKDNGTQVKATLNFLGETFGGATSTKADGVWKSEECGLVSEVITIVRTSVSKHALDKHLDKVVQFAVHLKQEMEQEAVAIDVDHQLILV